MLHNFAPTPNYALNNNTDQNNVMNQQYAHISPMQSFVPSNQLNRIPPIQSLDNSFQHYYGQVQPQPLSRLQGPKFPKPDIIIPRETEKEMSSLKPAYFRDPETGGYGIRCVCGGNHVDGFMIQCEQCEFWLHGTCVNVPRLSQTEPYFCPFCLGQRIRCCTKTNVYNEPLLQCTKCLNWVHKNCENLDYGIVPKPFICTKCNNGAPFEVPDVNFSPEFFNSKVLLDADNTEIMELLPEGLLKTVIEQDLNAGELEFQQTVQKYYRFFAPFLFDRPHEFWKVFSSALCALLKCEKATLLDAFDHLTLRLLYNFNIPNVQDFVKFGHSDSVAEYLEQHPLTRIEKPPEKVELYVGSDGHVYSPVALDDGAYITDLPGFLMYTDEVKADNGLPISCILITNSDIVVDMNGTNFALAPKIRRSFHFNTIVKLIRVKGETHCALFATRMKGPLSEEKNRRGAAIAENGEIILPFDGDLPFDVEKIEWKDKKVRPKPSNDNENSKEKHSQTQQSFSQQQQQTFSQQQSNSPQKQQQMDQQQMQHDFKNGGKKKKNDKFKGECDFQLSLLSSFTHEIVPPMPFVLLPDQNAVDKYKMLQLVKSHSRGKK